MGPGSARTAVSRRPCRCAVAPMFKAKLTQFVATLSVPKTRELNRALAQALGSREGEEPAT